MTYGQLYDKLTNIDKTTNGGVFTWDAYGAAVTCLRAIYSLYDYEPIRKYSEELIKYILIKI